MAKENIKLIKRKIKSADERKRNIVISILAIIVLGGSFCNRSNFIFGAEFAQGYELKKAAWQKKEYLEVLSGEKQFLGTLSDVNEGSSEEDSKTKELEKELHQLMVGYPTEEMVSHIAKYDRDVAGLIVGIAKKESDWGKHAPSKNGKTCYNYWGYKGGGSIGHSMGYGCFATAQEGVDAIGKRIQELVDKKVSTPSKMVIWKCGSSCAGHDPASVSKWISDVAIYFDKISKKG